MPGHGGLAQPWLSVSLSCRARLELPFSCQDLAPPQHPTWTSLEGWDRLSLPEMEISSSPGRFSCHSCHSMHAPFEARVSKRTRRALFPTPDCPLPHLRTGSRLRARSSKERDVLLCARGPSKGFQHGWKQLCLLKCKTGFRHTAEHCTQKNTHFAN